MTKSGVDVVTLAATSGNEYTVTFVKNKESNSPNLGLNFAIVMLGELKAPFFLSIP